MNCLVATWQFFRLSADDVNKQQREETPDISVRSHWLVNTKAKYYIINDPVSWRYEFRYQLLKTDNSHRLILLFGKQKRKCLDWWTFSVGQRILVAIRSSNLSILCISSNHSKFDHTSSIEQNLQIRSIYKLMQIWTNEVYYKLYGQYPQLYLYGTGEGSHFSSLLCRVLPIRAQILQTRLIDYKELAIRSSLPRDLQNRLALDSSFSSWFHFKYCYEKISEKCIFQSSVQLQYNPLPPTYFLRGSNETTSNLSDYLELVHRLQSDAYELGGTLLSNTLSLKLHVSFPANMTPFYMQQHFYPWLHKPHASQLFYEHFLGFKRLPEQQYAPSQFKTFLCHPADFIYFERYPSIMETWDEQQQQEYREYSNDIIKFHDLLAEEVCGDILGHDDILSVDINHTLSWLVKIDSVRLRLKLDDLISRPLRVWMYPKTDLVVNRFENHDIEANCSYNTYANQMYSSEYIIQDYFRNSNQINDALLADYFLIPHDLYCFIFFHQLFSNFTNEQFKQHVYYFSENYFEPIIKRVLSTFPYWTMTDKPGSNHIIAFVGGRNMGVLDDKLQSVIKNIIQLGPTGIRQDLVPKNWPELYLHRNLSTVYRHDYDIVIPPFTPTEKLKYNRSEEWYQSKKRLLYFAGIFNHSVSQGSARSVLREFLSDSPQIISIERKLFNSLLLVDGHVPMNDYLESMFSSIFSICPEGYSPWTPRIYEAMNLESIPLIIADGIVLPFERFIPWRSFSLKLNNTNVKNLLNFVIDNNNRSNFESLVRSKKQYGQTYVDAFRWLFKEKSRSNTFNSPSQSIDRHSNVFGYIYRELKCRRLEQYLGASADTSTELSQKARLDVCLSYSDTCPCEAGTSIAFDQFNY